MLQNLAIELEESSYEKMNKIKSIYIRFLLIMGEG